LGDFEVDHKIRQLHRPAVQAKRFEAVAGFAAAEIKRQLQAVIIDPGLVLVGVLPGLCLGSCGVFHEICPYLPPVLKLVRAGDLQQFRLARPELRPVLARQTRQAIVNPNLVTLHSQPEARHEIALTSFRPGR
jgi:hypothetical protein